MPLINRATTGLISVFCFALLAPWVAEACEAGMSYRKTTGEFLAEMLYDTYSIRRGQEVQFHFDLYNISNRSYGPGNPIDYSTVTARLMDGSNILREASVPRESFSETGIMWTMPRSNADYVMSVFYEKNGEKIASADFPVRVGRGNLWKTIFGMINAESNVREGLIVRRK